MKSNNFLVYIYIYIYIYIYSRTKSLTVQKQDKLSAFGFRLHQSSNICTGKRHESWKYIRVSTFVQVKNMNHENTQNQRKCIKIDTMYNSYEVNFSQIHIKWRKRNWKSPVNGPSLNLKLKMAAKIRRVHLWRFVAVYLWKSITCIYCMCLPFTYGAKLTVLKEKEKNTRKHIATKRMNGTECVWDDARWLCEGHLADWNGVRD